MPANVDPIYSKAGDVSTNGTTGMSALITAAGNDYTGISANYALVYTANATNGGFIQRLRLKAGGTNVAAVMRIFINNGAVHTTATNNVFYGEITLPATTSSTTQGTTDIDYPMGFAINPGFTIYAGLGATVAAGWAVMAVGGQY